MSYRCVGWCVISRKREMSPERARPACFRRRLVIDAALTRFLVLHGLGGFCPRGVSRRRGRGGERVVSGKHSGGVNERRIGGCEQGGHRRVKQCRRRRRNVGTRGRCTRRARCHRRAHTGYRAHGVHRASVTRESCGADERRHRAGRRSPGLRARSEGGNVAAGGAR